MGVKLASVVCFSDLKVWEEICVFIVISVIFIKYQTNKLKMCETF